MIARGAIHMLHVRLVRLSATNLLALEFGVALLAIFSGHGFSLCLGRKFEALAKGGWV